MRTEVKEFIQNVMIMDFIDGLPKSHGYEVILVVVDRLRKYGHFLPLKHPYTAQSVAHVFLDNIVKLHGILMPLQVIEMFYFLWQELLSLQGVLLHTSTAFHPQSDGQTEVLNRCLETYLRCYCSDDASNWFSCLPMVEYWYNTCFYSAIQITPYEALYGRPPPLHLPYLPGESSSTEIIKRIGPVAYTLLLPSSVKIHPTVHVSLLKRCYKVPFSITCPPTVELDNPNCPHPEAALQRRMVKKGNKAVAQVLVKWLDLPTDAATWEFVDVLKARFPSFDPRGHGSCMRGEYCYHK
ncbi:putative protein isoform X1 [Capsicum chacoense]